MVTRRTALSAMSFTDFGTLLRVLRHRARLTQRQLGIAVGYSEAQISGWSSGGGRPPARARGGGPQRPATG